LIMPFRQVGGVSWSSRPIRINAVCPGVIESPMFTDVLDTRTDALEEILKEQSLGRLGRADEVAAAVPWLSSPGAGLVVGVARPIDGGFTAH
jgi:NAD(P)-dependent dehydrogenase (short-subunit alcohol dehydrogenase family)